MASWLGWIVFQANSKQTPSSAVSRRANSKTIKTLLRTRSSGEKQSRGKPLAGFLLYDDEDDDEDGDAGD